MKQIFTMLVGCLLMTQIASAQTPNYSEHVAPIIYKHCTSCHRPGEIGPFSLTNYAEVVSKASTIQYATGIKFMPPWKPDPSYRHFIAENTLTDAEIATISAWVDGGTPQGNASLEPQLPVFPVGSEVGAPDLVLHFSQSYLHKGTGIDEYRYFVLPTGLTTDKDLVALEMRPGNRKIVHHTLFWSDDTGKADSIDKTTPEYGFEGSLNSAVSELDNQLPGFVPGMRPVSYNNGIAQKIKAGSDLKLQMHYAPVTSDESDSSTVNLFFSKTPTTRYVQSHVIVPFFGELQNGPFKINAGQVKDFHAIHTFNNKVSLLNISPHCHLVGVRWIVFAITPAGDTINLVKVPEWDFNWQGTYSFKSPIVLESGTQLHAWGKYDNTTNNPFNPFNPPKTIQWGENTTDEMYYLPFAWVDYQAGDENLILDPTSPTGINDNPAFQNITNKLYPIAPNPANDKVKIGFTLAESGKVNLAAFNMVGQQMNHLIENRTYMEGQHIMEMDVKDLSSGLYNIVLEINEKKYTQKLEVTN